MVDDDRAEPQRLTFMRLFQACGDLWLKELKVDELKDLQLRVVEAVCLAELHLPASEADIKMHDLIHLAFLNIPLWGKPCESKEWCPHVLYLCLIAGPLFPTSMFPAESTWGKVRPMARNRNHPAETILKSCLDKEMAVRVSYLC